MKSLLLLSLALIASSPAATAKPLTLSDVVMGFESGEGDFVFPMLAVSGYGELYLERTNVRISKNCARHIAIENDGLVCDPFGDKKRRFSFARFAGEHPESDSGWTAVFLDYDTSRVRLVTKVDRKNQRFLHFMRILSD